LDDARKRQLAERLTERDVMLVQQEIKKKRKKGKEKKEV
jgi:hypothetical protein